MDESVDVVVKDGGLLGTKEHKAARWVEEDNHVG
jgi:hypothetical protein